MPSREWGRNPATKTAEPVRATDRILSIDVLRGLALFGVLMVNLTTDFRISLFRQFLGPYAGQSVLDQTLEAGISFFFFMKAFALFSLLFGVGLAVQFEHLAKRTDRGVLLVRRLLVLLLFGCLHMVFIWDGDILTEYAIAGVVVLPCLWLSNSKVLAVSISLFALYLWFSIEQLPIKWWNESWLLRHVADANRICAKGTYLEILRFRIAELPAILPLHIEIFPRTLALFGFGILAWRTGLLTEPERNQTQLRALMIGGLLFGFAIAAFDQLGWIASWRALGPIRWALPNLGTTLLAFGYAATVLLGMQSQLIRRLLGPMAAMGRMAFTNYITQSVIFGWIYYGYGLGLFGKTGIGEAVLIGLAVYALQIFVSVLWLKSFRFGPLEWLWRSLMYGRYQAMRRTVTA